MELLERDAPLRELESALQDAVKGHGRIVLVSGEAGIGKTSLVEHFARAQKQRLLWGACDALFTPRPLGPLHDMALQVGGELATSLAGPVHLSTVFAAVFQELQKPGIVLFEDIHWADEATLDLLKYLGRRIQRTASLVIATYRDDELSPQHPLRLLLGDLARNSARQQIKLTPLSTPSIRQLIGTRPFDANRLREQTGGNPFFVTEILAAGDKGIPTTIRDAVLARVARLSLSGQAVLQATAVIGIQIEPWLLQEVTQAEATAVNESLNLGILQSQGTMLAFRHDLARQTILSIIPPHQQIFLHQAILDALQHTDIAQKDPARLTHHAQAANDPQAILKYAPIAGKEAASLGMNRAAAALYALALSHSQLLPLNQQISLFEAYALCVQVGPDKTKAIEAYRQAARLAQEAGLPDREGYHLARLSGLLEISGEYAEANDLLDKAIAILEPLPPSRGLVVAYIRQALKLFRQVNVTSAQVLAAKSYQLALNIEEMYLILGSYRMLGLCRLAEDYQQGIDHLEKCLAAALQHDEFWIGGIVYPDLIMVYVDSYRFDRAEELIAEGIAFAAEHDMELAKDTILAWQAMVYFYQGQWQKAEEIARDLLQRPILHRYATAPAKLVLGRLLLRQGKATAVSMLQEAADELYRWRAGTVYSAKAEAAWLAGDTRRLLAEADRAFEPGILIEQPGLGAELAYWRWQAGEDVETFAWMLRPFVLEIQGDWRSASQAWQTLGCPYEQARALAKGDKNARLNALTILEQLGAEPLANRVRQNLKAAGIEAIPRGPRATTRRNPFQLTNRQLEILTLLVENLTNAEIAARLHISPKTVDHHVSAILAKMAVSSREKAAEKARQHPDF